MNPYTIWLVLFGVIAYFIATDSSVARAFDMLIQLARVQYEKAKWWAVHNPANPIVKYFMWRRAYKIAQELQKELAEKRKDPV